MPTDLDEVALEARLFPPPPPSALSRPDPDWPDTHKALRLKGVTLALLWQEYKAQHPDGYQYSAFCDRYRCCLAIYFTADLSGYFVTLGERSLR